MDKKLFLAGFLDVQEIEGQVGTLHLTGFQVIREAGLRVCSSLDFWTRQTRIQEGFLILKLTGFRNQSSVMLVIRLK